MREWFEQLAPRERLVLIGGAALALVIVLWTFVWKPLDDGVGELRVSVDQRAQEVVDLKRAAGLGSTNLPGPVNDVTQSPLVLVDEKARQLGLQSAINRTNLDGINAINISFRGARFDRLVEFMIDLERDHGFAVVSAGITRSQSAAEGLVDGQIRLDRS